MLELIREAEAMLLDRIPQERDLIYAIAKLDPEARSAIVVAYEFILQEKIENGS